MMFSGKNRIQNPEYLICPGVGERMEEPGDSDLLSMPHGPHSWGRALTPSTCPSPSVTGQAHPPNLPRVSHTGLPTSCPQRLPAHWAVLERKGEALLKSHKTPNRMEVVTEKLGQEPPEHTHDIMPTDNNCEDLHHIQWSTFQKSGK